MKLFVFTLLFTFSNLFGQVNYIKYYNFVNEGEFHMYEGNYELAINNFEMAFEIVPRPKGRDYFCMAKCQSQIVELEKSLHFLFLAKKAGCTNDFIISDSLWFTHIYESHAFKEMLLINHSIEEDSLTNLKLQTLLSMEDRKMIFYKFQREKVSDTLSEAYLKNENDYQVYLDKYVNALSDFILTCNWPISNIKSRNISLLCRLYLNSDLPIYDSIVSSLYKQLESGYITPYDFALILEKKDPSNVQYGLALNSIPKNKLSEIQENRKLIGLSTYYSEAPNYNTNYKPSPIISNLRKEE